MKLFQVLTTNVFTDTINRQYTTVNNFASLAEAMRVFSIYEDKDVQDGVEYIGKFSGRKTVQFHLYYEENGGAVFELRHEYFGIPEGCTTEQVVNMDAVYLKEIDL